MDAWEAEMRRWLTEQIEAAVRNQQWQRKHALQDCLDHLDWVPANIAAQGRP